MFGVGPEEMVLIGLLLLILFGPEKLSGMARDFGGFVSKARDYKDELQAELLSDAEDETPEHEEVEEEPSLDGAADELEAEPVSGAEDETPEREKVEEETSVDGVARGEIPDAEEKAGATRTEQKS